MPGILEGFNTGFGAGSNIRKRWESDSARAAAREFQERQFQAMEKHRRFSEDLQQQQLALQQKAQDNVLMTQVHGLLSNPQLHPQAKAFMLDDIARQRGHDPKSEYYQGIKKVIITMPADQARALSSGLIAAYPKMQPGQIGKTVDGLLNGQIPATQIPGLIKELNAARQTDEQAANAAGVLGGGTGQPDVSTGQPGMPLDNFGQGGGAAPEQNGQKGALPAPAPVQNGQTGATSGYGGPEGGPGTVQTGASMDLPTDFSGQKGDFGGQPTGTLTSPGGDELAAMASQSGASLMPSAATPAMTGQLQQLQGVMDDQGGVPPGTSPGTLGELFGVTRAPKPRPVQSQAPTPQERYDASGMSKLPASAPVQIMQGAERHAGAADPKQTPEFWLEAAGKFDTMGPAYKEYADQARKQAKALGEAGEQKTKTAAAGAKVTDARVDDAGKAESAITGIDETIGLVDQLRVHPGLYKVPGKVPFGGEIDIRGTSLNYADLFPGTQGAEFFNKHKTLISNVALRTMQELKTMSSQGATGFGALSQKELKVLEDSAGALQLTNNPDTLVAAYDKFRDHLAKARAGIAERFQAKYGVGLNVGPLAEKPRVKDVTIESGLPFQLFGRKQKIKPGHPDIRP